MCDHAVLLNKVTKYVSLIERGDKVEHALNRLEHIPMTLDLLSSTGVGKVVNRLRSHIEYGIKARQIVERWRSMARDAQRDSAEQNSGSEYDSGNDTGSSARASTSTSPKKEAKVKIVKRKIEPVDNVDAFSAALAAADSVKTNKPKRPRADDHILAGIEKSLADSARPLARFDGLTTNKSTINDSFVDPTMFKARKATHKVYAGRKKIVLSNGEIPKLFDICLRFCINNIDSIEETGDIPFHVLKPVLEKCTHSQLAKIESKNRYLEDDTDYLWERHCIEVFPSFKSLDGEMWKTCFLRLTHERDNRLKKLSVKIGNNTRQSTMPQRKAMFADPIAPRDARRRQIKNGIVCHSSMVPNAADISRSRRQIFETGCSSDLKKLPFAIRSSAPSLSEASRSIGGGSSSSNRSNKNPLLCSKKFEPPKRGALMVKTLKMLKSRPR